jgi:hypothetical protein
MSPRVVHRSCGGQFLAWHEHDLSCLMTGPHLGLLSLEPRLTMVGQVRTPRLSVVELNDEICWQWLPNLKEVLVTDGEKIRTTRQPGRDTTGAVRWADFPGCVRLDLTPVLLDSSAGVVESFKRPENYVIEQVDFHSEERRLTASFVDPARAVGARLQLLKFEALHRYRVLPRDTARFNTQGRATIEWKGSGACAAAVVSGERLVTYRSFDGRWLRPDEEPGGTPERAAIECVLSVQQPADGPFSDWPLDAQSRLVGLAELGLAVLGLPRHAAHQCLKTHPEALARALILVKAGLWNGAMPDPATALAACRSELRDLIRSHWPALAGALQELSKADSQQWAIRHRDSNWLAEVVHWAGRSASPRVLDTCLVAAPLRRELIELLPVFSSMDPWQKTTAELAEEMELTPANGLPRSLVPRLADVRKAAFGAPVPGKQPPIEIAFQARLARIVSWMEGLAASNDIPAWPETAIAHDLHARAGRAAEVLGRILAELPTADDVSRVAAAVNCRLDSPIADSKVQAGGLLGRFAAELEFEAQPFIQPTHKTTTACLATLRSNVEKLALRAIGPAIRSALTPAIQRAPSWQCPLSRPRLAERERCQAAWENARGESLRQFLQATEGLVRRLQSLDQEEEDERKQLTAIAMNPRLAAILSARAERTPDEMRDAVQRGATPAAAAFSRDQRILLEAANQLLPILRRHATVPDDLQLACLSLERQTPLPAEALDYRSWLSEAIARFDSLDGTEAALERHLESQDFMLDSLLRHLPGGRVVIEAEVAGYLREREWRALAFALRTLAEWELRFGGTLPLAYLTWLPEVEMDAAGKAERRIRELLLGKGRDRFKQAAELLADQEIRQRVSAAHPVVEKRLIERFRSLASDTRLRQLIPEGLRQNWNAPGQMSAVVDWLGSALRTIGWSTFGSDGPLIPMPPLVGADRELLKQELRRRRLAPME